MRGHWRRGRACGTSTALEPKGTVCRAWQGKMRGRWGVVTLKVGGLGSGVTSGSGVEEAWGGQVWRETLGLRCCGHGVPGLQPESRPAEHLCPRVLGATRLRRQSLRLSPVRQLRHRHGPGGWRSWGPGKQCSGLGCKGHAIGPGMRGCGTAACGLCGSHFNAQSLSL